MSQYNKWQDMFYIEPRRSGEGPRVYFLKEKATGIPVGEYNSYLYAMNRAKFKFKRKMRQIDKILLGNI